MRSDYPDGLGPNDPTAGDRARTDHSSVRFTLKEGSKGEPWVLIEEEQPGLQVLKYGNAFLGLQFRSGIEFKDAQRFAHEMERMFDVLSYTKFDT
jgi:hypothetical protein